MAREFRVLQAFHDPAGWHARRPVPVPVPIACCTDVDVIGAPFYLMDLVDGVVVRESLPAGARRPIPARRVRARTRWSTRWPASTRSTGAPEGSTASGGPTATSNARCRAGSASSTRYKTRPLPEVDEAGEWLAARVPPAQPPGVIHGDYKLDNVMLAPRLPVELVAVVDWEQSTIGDPLVDLGWLLGLWAEPGDAASLAGVSPFAGRADVPTRRELLERYADDTDRDLEHVELLLRARAVQARVRDGGLVRRASVPVRATTPTSRRWSTASPRSPRRALEFANGATCSEAVRRRSSRRAVSR